MARLLARARVGQNAPLRKKIDSRERVFFILRQALEASSKNALTYDECLSGAIIYAYTANQPTRYTDPDGLQFAPTPWFMPRPIPGVTPRPLPITRDPIPWGIPEPLSPADREFCRQERRACAATCEKAECDPDRKGVFGGSIEKCIRGCLPEKCGGNGVGSS